MVGGLTCNACNSEFSDEALQKLHYKSEWHRYNLKRKVAGVPGVTEALFQARQSALATEQSKLNENPMLYECALCGKAYRSSKAHAQHLKSRAHSVRASQEPGLQSTGITVVKPLANRVANKPTSTSMSLVPRELEGEESADSGDEWEEVDPDDDLISDAKESILNLNLNELTSSSGVDPDVDGDDEELDTSCCFICDLKEKNIESCMVHMHKQHGFFIPDVEYLKDPEGLLTFVGLKVRRDFLCLYCNDRCQPFQSLEAVRKHMIAKGHCKLRYGDGGDDEEAELEEFYDYTRRCLCHLSLLPFEPSGLTSSLSWPKEINFFCISIFSFFFFLINWKLLADCKFLRDFEQLHFIEVGYNSKRMFCFAWFFGLKYLPKHYFTLFLSSLSFCSYFCRGCREASGENI